MRDLLTDARWESAVRGWAVKDLPPVVHRVTAAMGWAVKDLPSAERRESAARGWAVRNLPRVASRGLLETDSADSNRLSYGPGVLAG